MRFLIASITLLLITGCSSLPESESTAMPKEMEVLANSAAAATIKEFNSSVWAKENLPEPLKLEDYKKSRSTEVDPDGKKIHRVDYELEKQLDFRGHPNHFSVWVYEDKKTRIIAGR